MKLQQPNRWIFFVGIVAIVFLSFGVPFYEMGLDSDFFGLLWDVHETESWFSFWKTSLAQTYYPLNEVPESTNFFSFYRPLVQMFHQWEYIVFQSYWYAYFLTAMAILSLTTGTLFLLFNYAYSSIDAGLLALLWVVHPALSPSLLCVTGLLVISYLFVALSALMYARFYTRRSSGAYAASVFFYVCALLSYEVTMIVPVLLTIFIIFFARNRWRDVCPFIGINIIYFGLRFALMGFPSAAGAGVNISSCIARVIDNSIQAIKPFWGLQDASTSVAIVVTLTFVFLCVQHFVRFPQQRWQMLWLLLSFGAGSWGIILGNSSSRYFCMGLPFFVMLVYLILQGLLSLNLSRFVLVVLVVFGGVRTVYNQARREAYTAERDKAIQQLVAEYPTKNYFVLSAPHFCNNEIFLLSSGVMQGIQLVGNRPDAGVYHIIQIPLCAKAFPSQGKIDVTAIPSGYRLCSTSPESIWFMVPHGVDCMKISMGELVFHQKHSSWQATDVEIILKPEYRTKAWLDETTVVMWNPQQWRFEKVSSDHLCEDA